MRGVSVPTHEYARVAETYVQSFSIPPDDRDPAHLSAARNLTMSTRAYTRVVLRLRAQAEREAADAAAAKAANPPAPSKKRITSNGYASSRSSPSRTSSRAPSPNSGHSQPNHASAPAVGTAFRSPLFRVKRAPLLRVFVPSPDGDWLSDKSVLECEAELKRAGVLKLLRMGDVVWDIAVGDEGNVGRLVWDGSYLIVSLCCVVKLTELTFSTGLGLQVLLRRRSTAVSPDLSIPAFLFPPRHPDRAGLDQPCRPHRPSALGPRNRRQSPAPAGPRPNGNVRSPHLNLTPHN